MDGVRSERKGLSHQTAVNESKELRPTFDRRSMGVFLPSADQPHTDQDRLMVCQIFLGRDLGPEWQLPGQNTSSVRSLIQSVLKDRMFLHDVAKRLLVGAAIPHDSRADAVPTPGHIEWILNNLSFDAFWRSSLRSVACWRDMLRVLMSIPYLVDGEISTAVRSRGGSAVSSRQTDTFIHLHVDTPQHGESLQPNAVVAGSGWALGLTAINEVAILLDSKVLSFARIGMHRPSLAGRFPEIPWAGDSGFVFQAQLPPPHAFQSDSHFGIVVKTGNGDITRRNVLLSQPKTIAGLDTRGVVKVFIETIHASRSGEFEIAGWALSSTPIKGVIVRVGNTLLGAAQVGPSTPELAALYPDHPGAGVYGYDLRGRFDGEMPSAVLSICVEASDETGNKGQMTVPCDFRRAAETDSDAANSGIRAHCDLGRLNADGLLEVVGWAVGTLGIDSIGLELDGSYLGSAVMGVDRQDVAASFRDEPNARKSGFIFKQRIDINRDHAPFSLKIRVIGSNGRVFVIERKVGVEIPSAGRNERNADMQLELRGVVFDNGVGRCSRDSSFTLAGTILSYADIVNVSVFNGDTMLGVAHLRSQQSGLMPLLVKNNARIGTEFSLVVVPNSVGSGHHRLRVAARDRFGLEIEKSIDLLVETGPIGTAVRAPKIKIDQPALEFARRHLDRQHWHPQFELYLQCADSSEASLSRLLLTVASLYRQAYQGWQAIIVSPQGDSADKLRGLVELSTGLLPARLKVAEGPLSTSLEKANDRQNALGLEMAKGHSVKASERPRYICILQGGEELGADALVELALYLESNRSADFIYCDELRVDNCSNRPQPYLKPAWSPELLLSTNYIGSFSFVSASLFDQSGLAAVEPRLLSSYELALRFTELASNIAHLPRVLWSSCSSPSEPLDTQAAALADALARRYIKGDVVPCFPAGVWRIKRPLRPTKLVPPHAPWASGAKNSDRTPGRISIIIPTRGKGDLVKRAILSIREFSQPHDTEIVVVDSCSTKLESLKQWLGQNADVIVESSLGLNWAALSNAGASASTGEFLLFLREDVAVRDVNWMGPLLEYASQPDVGVVGPRLLYPDETLNHGGLYLNSSRVSRAFHCLPADALGPFGLTAAAREVIGVSGACLMTRHSTFEMIGRFDDEVDAAHTDIDYCLRARKAALSTIYTPHSTLVRTDPSTGSPRPEFDRDAGFFSKWRLELLLGDPYRNPSVMEASDQFVAEPEPTTVVYGGPKAPPIESIKKILAVKLDHIGDFIAALPALRSLRNRFPLAQIYLLAAPLSAAMARQAEVIDEVIEFSFFHDRSMDGLKDLSDSDYELLQATLGGHKFDMAIDLRAHLDTRPILRLTGAAFLVGFDHNRSFPWLDVSLEWEGDISRVAKSEHIAEKLLHLVAAAESSCQMTQIGIMAPKEAGKSGNLSHGLPHKFLTRQIVCVHAGVGNPVRQWSPASFAELINLLVDLQKVNVILIGSGEEIAIAEAVMDGIVNKAAVRSMAGKVSLGDLPNLIRACALFVGNNSGPQHIAASLGVPTIGVHSGVVDAAEWAPLGRSAMAVARQMTCSPCYLERVAECPREMACLNGLRPRDVYLACLRLIRSDTEARKRLPSHKSGNKERKDADADTFSV